jgi:dTDP-4-amino-4,6-dideoxygalactose transaminase
MADYLGAPHTAAVSSGTSALHLAMLAAGVGPGDEVILPTMTFAATANAVVHTGATPLLVDVDPETQNITAEAIDAAITPRTKVVIPVHFAGYPCAMDPILDVARRHDLRVIEDAAHCIEGRAAGRKVGTIGDATCFSFYVTKNLTTIEGGMVATQHADWCETITTRAIHGLSAGAWRRFADETFQHYEVTAPGFKYNMTDVQAAVGLHQLPLLDAWGRRRAELWARYDEAFADLPLRRPALPPAGSSDVHARHLYVLRLDLDGLTVDRDTVAEAIHAENVGVGVHYRALHLQPYYRDRFALQPERFPVADALSACTLSIPLSGTLTDDDADDVIAAVTKVLTGYASAESGATAAGR